APAWAGPSGWRGGGRGRPTACGARTGPRTPSLAYRKLSTGRDAILTERCERGDSGQVPEGLGEGVFRRHLRGADGHWGGRSGFGALGCPATTAGGDPACPARPGMRVHAVVPARAVRGAASLVPARRPGPDVAG